MVETQETYPDRARKPVNRSASRADSDAPRGVTDVAPTDAANTHTSLLGAVREMLVLAIEGAFDLRVGREQSPHLHRFEEMLNTQVDVLNTLEHGVFTSDPRYLTRRAQEALHGFAAAVQHEIIHDVRPGMSPTVFDAALRRMTERAVMAGAAFASLDLALEQL